MTDPDQLVSIAGDHLSAQINPFGAELHSLRDAAGRDYLWDGDPAVWAGRAPILFPIVGAVAGGVIRVDGQEYPMAKHGFARRMAWTPIARTPGSARFRLVADATTRAVYPFEFRLDIDFAIAGSALEMVATVHNDGATDMPASFGFHPAFRWPLPGGGARAEHRISFAAPEPMPIRRIDADGLLRPAPEPSPVDGDTLIVRDDLFDQDAMIFDRLESRHLRFGAPGATQIDIDFPDMPLLGVWTKPGATYLCIEPWQGIADPEGFAGALRDKPGTLIIAPETQRTFRMRIDIGGGSS